MILIKELTLNNFMRVKKAQLEFEKGKNIFLGPNKSGKSTVFEAIGFSLLGRKRGDTFSEYIRKGENHAYVRLVLQQGHLTMMIESTLIRGESTVQRKLTEIKENNVQRIFHNSEVTQYLEENFGAKLLESAVFSFQKGPALTDLKPSERKELISQIFGVDQLLDGVEDLMKESEQIEKEIQQLQIEEKSLERVTYVEEELLELPFSAQEYVEKQQELQKVQKKIHDKEQEYQKHEEFRRNFEENQRLQRERQKSYEGVLRSLEETDRGISLIRQDQEAVKKETEEVSSQIEKVSQQSNEYTMNEFGVEVIWDLLTESVEDYLRKNSSLPFKTSQQLQELALQKERILLELKHYQEKRKIFEQGICPVCGQKIDPTHVHLEMEKLGALEAEWEKLTQEEKEQQVLRQKVQQVISYGESYFSLVEKKKKLVERAHLKEQEKQRLEAQRENYLLKAQQLKQEIDSYQEMANFDVVSLKQELGLLKEEEKRIDSQLRHYQTVEATNEERRRLNEKRKQQYEEAQKELQRVRDVIHEKNLELHWMSKAKKVLTNELPQFFLGHVCQEVERMMNDFIAQVDSTNQVKLFPTKTGIEVAFLNQSVFDSNLNLENSENYFSIKMSSGYEREIITLAFKVAIAYFYKVRILVLDEVDASSDDGHSLDIFRALAQLAMDQVFIVTHRISTVENLLRDYVAKVFQVSEGNFKILA